MAEKRVSFAEPDRRYKGTHMVFETNRAGFHRLEAEGAVAMFYFRPHLQVIGASGQAYALPTVDDHHERYDDVLMWNQFFNLLMHVEAHPDILFVLGTFTRVRLEDELRYLKPAIKNPRKYHNIVWPMRFREVEGFPVEAVRWHDGNYRWHARPSRAVLDRTPHPFDRKPRAIGDDLLAKVVANEPFTPPDNGWRPPPVPDDWFGEIDEMNW